MGKAYTAAVIAALTAQRNREADAVAEINGHLADARATIDTLRERVAALEAALGLAGSDGDQ